VGSSQLHRLISTMDIDRSSVSPSVVKCMFLGSRDKAIVAGDAPSAEVQVLYGAADVGNDESFQPVARSQHTGTCTDFELCGVGRLGRTFGAVALWDMHNSESTVSLLNLDTDLSGASISVHSATLVKDSVPISSLSFSSEMELLAVANEGGIVSVRELSSGRTVCNIKADPCGVKKVLFTRTGQLVTVGESTKAQIKIWDLRAAGNNQATLVLATDLSDSIASPHIGHDRRGTSATCVCLHPVHEKLVSGCADGSVQLWDLRSSTNLTFRSHGNSSGTTLIVILCVA
jgi:WD40 repeat protein